MRQGGNLPIMPGCSTELARVKRCSPDFATLKRMFTLACQAAKLLAASHIPMLQEDNVRRGVFEREQFESVRRRLPEEVRPVVTFGYLTGWRINSEMLTMQWQQVDLRAGIVRLDPGTTKNREGRSFTFSMLPQLRELLEEQRAATTIIERETGRIVPWVFPRCRQRSRFADSRRICGGQGGN